MNPRDGRHIGMVFAVLFLAALFIFVLGYRFYGRFLFRVYDLDDRNLTPAHTDYDGMDRIPARKVVLLGHHFSSIAGAGPIVGPIIASLAFGWLPALLWILAGTIFVGGVHDFSSLVTSIRHRGRSIAELAREYMSPLAYRLFLIFIWLALIYILVVFIDLTANTFTMNGGVATSSILYILLAIAFGFTLYRLKLPLITGTLIFVPLIFISVWIGQMIPINPDGIPAIIEGSPSKSWAIFLVAYCFTASITPVWILLQPRDYLSSYLLYSSVLIGFIGIISGGFIVHYPAFINWNAAGLGHLFPILFITVACGACSGFHSIVASGTTSKQLDRETDALPVGYGAMLLEGVVAVIALGTVIMVARGDPLTGEQPLVIYATGLGRFARALGIPEGIGYSFGLLTLSTFILTTLDTGTRLSRYIFEEFFDLKGRGIRYLSTTATLLLPTIFVLITMKDPLGNPIPAWKAIWPVFGSTNQLLAGLVLLVILLWLKKRGKKTLFILIPMLFMLAIAVWALLLLLGRYRFTSIGIIATVLLLLAALLAWETGRGVRRWKREG